MKTYRHLLFDVDDTLLDFGAAELSAFRRMCDDHGHAFSDALYARYKEINHGLWRAYEDGRITREVVLHSRYETLFKEQGLKVEGRVLDDTYRRYLSAGHHLLEGALELIHELKDAFSLYIVSNGVSTIQDARLRGSGLHPHFEAVFVSEDTGYQKPHKGFFDHVFSRIPQFDPSRALIIGDSLSADIVGGHRAGIDTCWFNPGAKPNDADVTPTYEIRHYDELRAIVGAANASLA